jgi:hypothetical protein
MKLDPKKTDFSRLVSLLKKVAVYSANPKDERNWADDTAKTLLAGKLEDFDLEEFVAQAYETDLSKREDKRPVWDYAQAMIALIDEMHSKGIRAGRAKDVGATLKGWKKDPGA